MFRNARRIAALALIAGAALPVASASAGVYMKVEGVTGEPSSASASHALYQDISIPSGSGGTAAINGNLQIPDLTSATDEPDAALLLPAVQAAREAARR